VSSLPTIFGEKIVMRVLDKSNLNIDLEKLGFEPRAMKDFVSAIASPYGMVLVTGPTGSGKTTTLYSALSRVNTPDVNVLNAEDPVEYNLDGSSGPRERGVGLSLRRRAQGVPAAGPPTSSWWARSATSIRRRSR
jgi:Tfp pilus assembly pilus retraction ATPase PilT